MPPCPENYPIGQLSARYHLPNELYRFVHYFSSHLDLTVCFFLCSTTSTAETDAIFLQTSQFHLLLVNYSDLHANDKQAKLILSTIRLVVLMGSGSPQYDLPACLP